MRSERTREEVEGGPQPGLGRDQVVQGLVDLLRQRRGEVAAAWVDVICRKMAGTDYGRRPPEEILENNLTSVDLLIEFLQGTDTIPPTWEGQLQFPDYLLQGPRVDEIMEAVRLWRPILGLLVAETFPAGAPSTQEALLRLESSLNLFAAVVVELVGAQTTEYLAEQQRRTALMLEMARTASASLDLEEVLRRAARSIASAAGVESSSICLIDEEGPTGTLLPGATPTTLTAAHFYGAGGQRAVNLGESTFVRRVLEEKRAVIWQDVQNDPTVGDELRALGMRLVIGVPCAINERVLAVAFAVTSNPHQLLTAGQVEMAQGVANVVAPAIENARLHHRVGQMSTLEERARLAQELHDRLAQTLGAMQFYTSLISESLEQGQVSQAQAGLSLLRQAVDEAHVDVREAIFNLRSMASLQMCGLAALQSYLSAYEQRYGVAVQLRADPEAAGVLVGEAGAQAFRILQEALTNVRKHGQTARARVDLQREGTWASITIQDEGQGFDPVLVRDQDPAGFGLQVMRERALRVGGTLSVESQPGQGTRVVLRVPCPEGVGAR
ncbi:MAG TPA: GAF domain-containing sensor histidine kinase [Anaerolineae bacterium]|nr:GAF domain-containing sensor histidine kinase [Anaerolineae bacterium]